MKDKKHQRNRNLLFRFITLAGSPCPTEDKCWNWLSSKTKQGYGKLGFKKHNQLAHRISWELFRGKIPEEMQVLHKCDNPSCVNPRHLWLGTNADNVADRVKKNRTRIGDRRGEKNGMARFTEEDIKTIRSLYPEFTQAEIGKRFGIHQSVVSAIVLRKLWKHI